MLNVDQKKGETTVKKLYKGIVSNDFTYLVSNKISRLLLSLNQRIEVKTFQEAVDGVEIQLWLLKQIPTHIHFSTSLAYGVVSKLAYFETIPKM